MRPADYTIPYKTTTTTTTLSGCYDSGEFLLCENWCTETKTSSSNSSSSSTVGK